MSFWLVMRTAAGGERPFRISKPRTVIGREATSDLQVSIHSVAPRHCEITLDEDGLHLTDLGSATGTLHNGTPVGRAALADSDQLTVGTVTFEVCRTIEEPASAEPKLPQIETHVRQPEAKPGGQAVFRDTP